MSLLDQVLQEKKRTSDAFDQLANQLREIDMQLAELEQQEIIEAKPHWQGAYMYLEYPGKGGAKRTRKYVGNKSANICQALEGIERYQLKVQLENRREFYKARFYEARFVMNSFQQRLKLKEEK